MSDLPSYPSEAAEREAAIGPDRTAHDLAGWWRRLGAYLVDTILLLIPLAVVFALVLASPDDAGGAWLGLVVVYFVSLALPFVYFTVLHGNERGQTYGKRALGIRVVDDKSGGPLGNGRAFGRYLITIVFGFFVLPVVLDYLWPLWDGKNQALHDKVVGSVVVRT